MASGAPNMLQQRLQDTILEHLGPIFDVFSRNIERFSDHLQWIAQVAGGHREANGISPGSKMAKNVVQWIPGEILG